MANNYNLRRLSIAVFTALMSATASHAYNFEVDGIYYSITSWTNLEVKVTYEIKKSASYSGDVVIPDNVTYDGSTFSVTSIGQYAFYYCDGLTSIEIPNSVTSIGQYAFYDCSGLKSVEIPNSVTSIGSNVFCNCTGLRSIEISNSVTSISDYAFFSCDELRSVEIPNSVTNIGKYAFHDCGELKSVEISNNVTNIGKGAFSSCGGLKSIDVDEDNENYCSSDGVLFDKNIDTLLCYPAGKTDKIYTVPETVTIIDMDAFSNCDGLKSIEIPNSVTSIRDYAFEYCDGLKSVEIPNSVTNIGDGAFEYCTALTSVEISSSVTCIGNNPFFGCFNLTSIVVEEDNRYYCSSDGVLFDKNIDTLLCYPAGKTDKIYTVPETVTIIDKYAFYHCDNLRSAEIPISVTSIGFMAFGYCSGLTSIEVDDENEYYCSLDGVLFDKEMDTLICYPAGKTDKSYTIPETVTIIEEEAIATCDGLTSVVIPNSVTSIGYRAFYHCSGLTSVVIPNSVTSIGEQAFRSCNDLASVVIGSSVTSLGYYTFYPCSQLKDVYSLNVTPPSCDDYAFKYHDEATLYVPSTAVEDYKNANVWCEFGNIVGLETSYTVGLLVSDEEVSIGDSITLIATIKDFETDYLYTDTVYAWYVSVDDGEEELIDAAASDSIVYALTAAGTYSFYCSVTINDVTINSDKAVVAVAETETDDDAGISDITTDETGEYSVYSLGGVLLMKTKDSSEVESLPEGIYIVNGKKVAIKR